MKLIGLFFVFTIVLLLLIAMKHFLGFEPTVIGTLAMIIAQDIIKGEPE